MFVQFRHIPEQRESEWLGPFRFAQVTYDTVQVETPEHAWSFLMEETHENLEKPE